MYPAEKIKDLSERIDVVTQRVNVAFHNLSSDQINWKPGPDRWSIGQVIDHLITTNASYNPIFKELLAGKTDPPWHARIGWVVNYLGKLILKSVSPANARKTKTLRIWEPTRSEIPSSVFNTFEESQQDLKDWITQFGVFKDWSVVISSPANRNIVYTLETALEIIVTHEERHLDQALLVNTQMQQYFNATE